MNNAKKLKNWKVCSSMFAGVDTILFTTYDSSRSPQSCRCHQDTIRRLTTPVSNAYICLQTNCITPVSSASAPKLLHPWEAARRERRHYLLRTTTHGSSGSLPDFLQLEHFALCRNCYCYTSDNRDVRIRYLVGFTKVYDWLFCLRICLGWPCWRIITQYSFFYRVHITVSIMPIYEFIKQRTSVRIFLLFLAGGFLSFYL